MLLCDDQSRGLNSAQTLNKLASKCKVTPLWQLQVWPEFLPSPGPGFEGLLPLLGYMSSSREPQEQEGIQSLCNNTPKV